LIGKRWALDGATQMLSPFKTGVIAQDGMVLSILLSKPPPWMPWKLCMGGGNGTQTDAKIYSLAVMMIMDGDAVSAKFLWMTRTTQKLCRHSDTAPTAVQRWTEKGKTMREKLIDVFCTVLGAEPDYRNEDAVQFVDELIANGVTVQKWIPVTERLPEKDVLVLCIGAKGGMFLGYPRWMSHDDTAYTRVPNARGGRYTKYWCYLPEPPKGE
jgi:hypothetical protein